MMTRTTKHTWQFARYFRSGVYKWNGTALASKRITEAVRELKKAAKTQPDAAAEGVVLFLEKCWKAIQHIDSSSGAIGNRVNSAIADTTEIFGKADVSSDVRMRLMERIWDAWQEEDYGYYDMLGEQWPVLCAGPDLCSRWADDFLPTVRMVLNDRLPGAYFKGTIPCLACLVSAGRHEEVLELLGMEQRPFVHHRQYGALALAAQGKIDEAIAYLEQKASADINAGYLPDYIGEKILREAGREAEAYERFGLRANMQTTGVATFSALRKKYPKIPPARMISDLIETEPLNEGKYFAAARKAGLDDLAYKIAMRAHVNPKTLVTAARDTLGRNPLRAMEYGLLALRRYSEGYGFDVTAFDILQAHDAAKGAAEAGKQEGEFVKRLAQIISEDQTPGGFFRKALGAR